MMKVRTIAGMTWTFLENFGNKSIQFAVGIFLARMLTPTEYGLVGMVMVFLALSHVVMDSGFSQALIRKRDCRPEDLNTAFAFNMATGLALYLVVFAAADFIAAFFGQPQLAGLSRVAGLVLVINATGIVQRAVLSRALDFKAQAFASVVATLVSSLVAVAMAWKGFGVWSLVARMLVEGAVTSLILWRSSSARVHLAFDRNAFRDLFTFGSRMVASGLIDQIFNEGYKVVIAKGFSIRELGFYTRASQFSDMPSSGFSSIIERVSYPVLSQVDPERLNGAFRRLLKTVTFVVFTLMLGMAATANNLILVLLGPQWEPATPYLELLCLATMLYPLQSLNLQILMVRGLSGLFLKLEIYKKILAVPTVLIGLKFGILAMLWAMILESILAYFINSFNTGRLIGYSTGRQILDVLPGLSISGAMASMVYGLGILLPAGTLASLILQTTAGALLIVVGCEWIRFEPWIEVRQAAEGMIRSRFGRISP
ncbi:MAG: lipopolysaccharide biosynthesis protein [Fibrobacteria bacterium]|nr:lipopolysaccharide biosynthesis protein [Fibrobacteria bacterium]